MWDVENDEKKSRVRKGTLAMLKIQDAQARVLLPSVARGWAAPDGRVGY